MIITMKNMTLANIAGACGGRLFLNGKDTGREAHTDKEAQGVVIDSRLVEKDYIFIATVGERVDGHSYIDAAFDKGALAVVCEKAPVMPKGSYILVDNSLEALKSIAKWYRTQLSVKVIGITGSVGKTSTKEFISSVLEQRYKVLKTEGNFNNEVGLPLTILKIREEHEAAVLEMGISHFGEMHRLSEIAKPDVCVITNIGQCHLENLGTRQGILKAKTEIFDFMNDNGSVCLNGDDDLLSTIQEVKGKKPLHFGSGSGNDFYATDIKTRGLFGSSCILHIQDAALKAETPDPDTKMIHVDIPLPGEHMVLNALAAACVGTLFHMSCEEIAAGIATVRTVGGRSNIIRKEHRTIIDDCYNANPVSMKAAIDLLCMADTNKVAILGDMGELGETENALHKEVGVYAAEKAINILICVGKLSSHMYDGASDIYERRQKNGSTDYELLYFETRDELIEALPSIIKEDDTILVKASHFMEFEKVVKALL